MYMVEMNGSCCLQSQMVLNFKLQCGVEGLPGILSKELVNGLENG